MKCLLNVPLLAIACAASPGFAQGFPDKPVRLIVPYPPGGANDIVARLLAPSMGEQLGQNVVVDNRGGGNTIIRSELAATAAPKAAIGRLHSVVQVALRQAEIREKLLGAGVEVVNATAAQFGELIKTELAKWDKVVKPLGIIPE